MGRAGAPAATHSSGRSPVTTDPAATTTWRPMRAPGSTTVPCPSHDPAPTTTARSGCAWREVGAGDVLVAVVLGDEVDVVARPDVVADVDGQVADEAAAPADQAPVADAHHGVGDTLLPGRHARRERHLRADQGAGADVDVALV